MPTRSVHRTLTALLVTAGLLAAIGAPAHAQFVAYDDFSSGAIDPVKWQGSSTEGPLAGPTGNARRLVENGSLRLALTSWGGDSSDSGFVTTRQRLMIRQLGTLGGAGFITGMRARITPINVDVQDCAANDDTSSGGTTALRARARFWGWFFNDGSGGPNNRTGNVLATLQLVGEAGGAKSIRAFLQRCSDAPCDTSTFPFVDAVFNTTWSLNTPLVYELVWDSANGKFTFTLRDPATLATIESKAIVYQGVLSNAGPPTVATLNTLEVMNSVKNCTSARKRVLMDALFDDVQVRRQP